MHYHHTLLVGALASAIACARPANVPWAHTEREAASKILAERSGLRLATKADNVSTGLADFLADNPGRDPYRLIADLNRDSIDDLTLAFRNDSTRKFHVFWFPGRDDGFGAPQELGTADWLANGGILWLDGRFGLGELYSDVIFWYGWDSVTGTMRLEPVPTDGPFTRSPD